MSDAEEMVKRLRRPVEWYANAGIGQQERDTAPFDAISLIERQAAEIKNLRHEWIRPDAIWGLEATINTLRQENARLREALLAFMERYKDDEEAWDAGPLECWVKARAALAGSRE